ncbi:conserved hypothetical protein [Nostocoides japonicum T1-X7]|uniref:Bacteriocin-protection protein, YdeI/OmpD-associated family n=1 Tax=Nostocoides japonicum T1-X7 TaxID=1194083 RepID=A0A077LZI6_9MICO|nr:conserved hypothetical protein [Tetrasphaera japonica T1-X7]
MGGTPERPAVFFADGAELRAWFEANHGTATELWTGFWKKHTGRPGLTWEEAVLEALCFGWIDSVAQRIDEDSTRQRWTPRKPSSNWSRINVAAVERLIAEGRMRPSGLAAYERRREDRTGVYSFEQDASLELPEPYAELLAGSVAAQAFWELATVSYRRVATHWVLSAKQATTRDRRMAQLVEDCAAGRLIPPQRYGSEPVWVGRARETLGLPAPE